MVRVLLPVPPPAPPAPTRRGGCDVGRLVVDLPLGATGLLQDLGDVSAAAAGAAGGGEAPVKSIASPARRFASDDDSSRVDLLDPDLAASF